MNLIKITIKSFKKELLELYCTFLSNVFKKSNIKKALVSVPKKKKRLTLLKSPHVHKKAREQFEMCLHKKVFYIENFKHLNCLNALVINKPKLINLYIKYVGK